MKRREFLAGTKAVTQTQNSARGERLAHALIEMYTFSFPPVRPRTKVRIFRSFCERRDSNHTQQLALKKTRNAFARQTRLEEPSMILDASRSFVVECHASAPTTVLGRDWIHYQDTRIRRTATGACFLALAKTKPIRIFGPAFVRDSHTQATLYSSVRIANACFTSQVAVKYAHFRRELHSSFLDFLPNLLARSNPRAVRRLSPGGVCSASSHHKAKLVRALFSSHSIPACFESILVILEFPIRKLLSTCVNSLLAFGATLRHLGNPTQFS